jgi:peptide/nickel transport system ATP-binding protein
MYSGEAVETGRAPDVFSAVRHPYTQGLFRSMAMSGTNKNDNPLIPIPGQLPLPHERPNGCNFSPRCAHFVAGSCDRADVPMRDVADHPGHQSRCLRVEAIDWAASALKGERLSPVGIGPQVLEVDRLKKHYRVAASALLGGGEARTVKAIEDVSFAARDARFWRSSASRAAASRRSPRCCSGSNSRARDSSCLTMRRSRTGRSSIARSGRFPRSR